MRRLLDERVVTQRTRTILEPPNDVIIIIIIIIIIIRNDLKIHETRNISDRNRRFAASCAIIKVT